jgi:hypothetical protein
MHVVSNNPADPSTARDKDIVSVDFQLSFPLAVTVLLGGKDTILSTIDPSALVYRATRMIHWQQQGLDEVYSAVNERDGGLSVEIRSDSGLNLAPAIPPQVRVDLIPRVEFAALWCLNRSGDPLTAFPGSTVTVGFRSSEVLSVPPNISIAGITCDPVIRSGGDTFHCSVILPTGMAPGVATYTISNLVDMTGNTGQSVTYNSTVQGSVQAEGTLGYSVFVLSL